MNRTRNQNLRQMYRDQGRYAKVNPCYRCGISAGIDYHSFNGDTIDSLGNQWNDSALCLDEKCCHYLKNLTPEEAWADLNHPNWGKHPRGKPPVG